MNHALPKETKGEKEHSLFRCLLLFSANNKWFMVPLRTRSKSKLSLILKVGRVTPRAPSLGAIGSGAPGVTRSTFAIGSCCHYQRGGCT